LKNHKGFNSQRRLSGIAKVKTTRFDDPEIRKLGLESINIRASTKFHLNRFSYFDPEKRICKLCYEKITPMINKDGEYVMINTIDRKHHRVQLRFGGSFYCKMAKEEEKKD
jgi:hypothetical protein